MIPNNQKEPVPDSQADTPPADQPSEEPMDPETLYQQTWAEVAKPEPPPKQSRWKVAWLVGTLGLFLLPLAPLVDTSFALPLGLVGAVLLHEAGHYLAMRLLGYRDLRVFFVPFFGGAATGEKYAAPVWQQVVVLLAGPLPGLALAVALYLIFRPPLLWEGEASSLAIVLCCLLLVNSLNLLPFEPLDGGRALNLLVFGRHPVLDALFRLVGIGGLCWLGWALGRWLFYALAAAIAISAPFRYRRAKHLAALRRDLPGLPSRLADLTEEQRRALFGHAHALVPEVVTDPVSCASDVKSLHEQAITRPLSRAQTVGLFGLYVAGLAACLAILQLDVWNLAGLQAEAADWVRGQGITVPRLSLREVARLKPMGGKPPARFDPKARLLVRYVADLRAADGRTLRLEVERTNRRSVWYTLRDGRGRVVATGGSLVVAIGTP